MCLGKVEAHHLRQREVADSLDEITHLTLSAVLADSGSDDRLMTDPRKSSQLCN